MHGDDEEKMLRRGAVFEAFKGSEAYKEVLDVLESLADNALGELRADKQNNPLNSMGLQIRWQEREYVLTKLQEEILSTIEDRRRLLAERQEKVERWENG